MQHHYLQVQNASQQSVGRDRHPARVRDLQERRPVRCRHGRRLRRSVPATEPRPEESR